MSDFLIPSLRAIGGRKKKKRKQRFSKRLDCELLFIAAHSEKGEEGVIAARGRSVQRGEALGEESSRVVGVVEHQARLLLREGEGASAQQMMAFYSSREISLTNKREPLLLPPVSQGEFCHINAAGRRDGNHAAHTHLPNFCLFHFFFFFFPRRLEYR